MSNKRNVKRPIKPTLRFKPGLYIIEVQHDDWCAYWHRKQADDCNCSPNEVVKPFADMKGLN